MQSGRPSKKYTGDTEVPDVSAFPAGGRYEELLDVVLMLLAERGYDGFRMSEVAERAKVSYSTIYKAYPTRDSLIAGAAGQWLSREVFPGIEYAAPSSLADFLETLLQTMFDPLEQAPWMAEVCHRVFSGQAGAALELQHNILVESAARPLFDCLDSDYRDDLAMILSQLFSSLMAEVARHTRSVGEAHDLMRRAVQRLTADNTSFAGSLAKINNKE